MKNKIIGILVCTLMIATAAVPVLSVQKKSAGCEENIIFGEINTNIPIEIPMLDPPEGYGTGGSLHTLMDLSYIDGQKIPDEFLTCGLLQLNFDWRTSGKVTSVKDQSTCGACYAFAGVANFESQVLIDASPPSHPDYSENNAKECNWREINNFIDGSGNPWGGCSGGDFEILASLWSQKGVVLESCDPYVANDAGSCKTTCTYQKTALDWRLISTNTVPSTTVLQNYIQNVGPIYTTVHVDAGQGFHSGYDGSYTFDYTVSPSVGTNHAVLIVGWNNNLPPTPSNPGTPATGWIVKNSWGSGWGASGYFYIIYGAANIGMWSSTLDQWQNYDSSGGILYYDDDCWNTAWGYTGYNYAWGMCKYIPSSNIGVSRVEFWTTDQATADVYLYDNFVSGNLQNLLWSNTGNSFSEAGYHGVSVSPTVSISSGNDVYAAVKFTNSGSTGPIAGDKNSMTSTGRSYMSLSGGSGSWTDTGTLSPPCDVGIRIRYTTTTNNPPTVSITSPTNGATVSGTVNIQGTASDSDGNVALVEYKIDSGSWQTASGTTSWSANWDSTTVSDGSHTIYARSKDNNNAYSTTASVTVTVNNGGTNNPPNTPSKPSGPTTGTIGVQYQYSTSTTDQDLGDTIKYGWDLDGDGIVNPAHWTSYFPSGAQCNVGITFGSPATYYVSVVAEDNHGARSSFSPALTVVISSGTNNPPTVSITSPTNGATVSGIVNIQGTASDADGNVQLVEYKIDSGSWTTATGTTSWSANWDSTTVSSGQHTIYARSKDNGDAYSTVDSVTVNAGANQPPNKPSKPSGPPSGKINVEHTYTASTTDPDGDSISYLFDWGDGTDSGWTNPIPSGQTATETHKWTTKGTYQVKVKARDVPSLEESDWSDPLSISMAKNKQLINLEPGIYVDNAKKISFPITIFVGDADIIVDAEGANRVEFYIDGVKKDTDYDSPYIWTWDEFSFGGHTLKVIAYDDNGNSATDKMEVYKFF